MGRRVYILACAAALCAGVTSCEKLEPEGTLSFEKVGSLTAISKDYGDIVGMTSVPGSPDWVHVWFQKPDKTIVVLSVDVTNGRIYGRALMVPRN